MTKKDKKLCLATYNIWNSNEGMPFRYECIIHEIQKVNPDILCLQEVQNKEIAHRIADELDMSFYFTGYEKDEEGICIFSKYPFTVNENWIHMNAQYVTFQYESKTVGIVNLHLPWDSVIQREKCISDIVSELDDKKCDYLFILGDFNSGDYSNVVRMIMGDCSLNGIEANPCFYDLALASAQRNGVPVKDTLNFLNNPRFCNNTIEINQRIDRIFIRNTYPVPFPQLIECDIFGTEVYSEMNLSASDHYGVYAVIESE